ncbi:MAG: type I-C CRISPR-associated protein Cas5 [Actinomycetota bacterium]|nr:MAG: type I-C CRISPR-associated protein Cas5 [Actinomycetota bacterium]
MSGSHHSWAEVATGGPFRYSSLKVEASGDLACFTRPELASERVSYPIMTPTAAVGLLSAVFWKPQFRWVVERIDVLKPVKWTTFRRNESGSAITRDHVMRGYLDVDDMVQQRMTTMLRDVSYRIHANVSVHPEADEQDPAKWRDQFLRRVKRGQSFRQPFLGMRELHADVVEAGDSAPVQWDEDLGIMLHSISYDEGTGAEAYDWFEAKVSNGVMEIPRSGLMAERSEGTA